MAQALGGVAARIPADATTFGSRHAVHYLAINATACLVVMAPGRQPGLSTARQPTLGSPLPTAGNLVQFNDNFRPAPTGSRPAGRPLARGRRPPARPYRPPHPCAMSTNRE